MSLEAAGILLLLRRLSEKVLYAPELIVLYHVVSFFWKVYPYLLWNERVVHVQDEMSFPKAVLLVCWVPFDSGTLTETWTSSAFQVAKAKSIRTEVKGCTHSASILKSKSIYCDRMHSI